MTKRANFYGFTFDPVLQRKSPVRIINACRFRSDDITLSQELKIPHWVLDCPLSYCGRTRVSGTGRWLRRDTGCAHLYAPGTGWIEDNRDAGMHESCYIIFDGGEILGLERLTGKSSFAPIYDPGTELGKRISSIAACGVRRGNKGILAAVGELYGLCDYLSEHAEAEPDGSWRLFPRPREETDLGKRVRNYIEQHYKEHLSLKNIAAALNISRSALTHRYRLETGNTVMWTLNETRLLQSLPLLQRQIPLKQIAAEIGISDEFQFSRVFKHHYGASPVNWRKNTSHS